MGKSTPLESRSKCFPLMANLLLPSAMHRDDIGKGIKIHKLGAFPDFCQSFLRTGPTSFLMC